MYFITKVPCIKGLENIDTIFNIDWETDDTTTVGFFKTLKEAELAVESGDIDVWGPQEGYVVIEQIEPGLFMGSKTVKWYCYNEVTEKYRITDVESIITNFAEIG